MKFVESFRAGELFRGFGVRLLVIQRADRCRDGGGIGIRADLY